MSWSTLHYDNSYSRLPGHFYTRVLPEPLPEPYLIHMNSSVASLLGIDIGSESVAQMLPILSGNHVASEHEPLSMLYAGHQFGRWVAQLGDGRAIQLAEILDQQNQRWTLQLKGAGPPPYSRNADGRAVCCARRYANISVVKQCMN